MGIFTAKEPIIEANALIGEYGDYWDNVLGEWEIIWSTAHFPTAIAMFEGGLLQNRGYRMVNGIYYMLFFLPPAGKHRQE